MISPRALAAALIATAALAVLPFAGAVVVGARRIEVARHQAQRIAEALRRTSSPGREEFLLGPGNIPRFDSEAWPGRKTDLRVDLPGSPVQADPWRNAYLVNLGGRGTVCVISAGPNGIVETRYQDASRPGGDDIAVPVW